MSIVSSNGSDKIVSKTKSKYDFFGLQIIKK